MSDEIPELLNRNLQEVFERRRCRPPSAVIEKLYTEDCVLYIAARHLRRTRRVGQVRRRPQKRDPSSLRVHATQQEEPQALASTGRATWGRSPRGERPDYTEAWT